MALKVAHEHLLAFSHSDTGSTYGFDEIYDSWATVTQPIAGFPDFQVTYTPRKLPVLSPCTSFEQRFPAAQQLTCPASRLLE